MSGAQDWLRSLEQDGDGGFSLAFARLGLTADCRRLSTAEIGEAMAMGGERAARYLLYLACPDLQKAGAAMQQDKKLLSPFDITLRLPYADVLQAASYILEQSGGSEGMVQLQLPEGAEALSGSVAEPGDAASDPETGSSPFAAAAQLTKSWSGAWQAEPAAARPAVLSGGPPASAVAGVDQPTAEAFARELANRLTDAAGNM